MIRTKLQIGRRQWQRSGAIHKEKRRFSLVRQTKHPKTLEVSAHYLNCNERRVKGQTVSHLKGGGRPL